jgi:outer membrane lipoprotein-sorting protein
VKSAENIKRLFKNAVVTTNAAPDEDVFECIQAAYTTSIENRSAQPKPIIWSSIMKNPKTKLAVAAIIVLTAAVMISLWRGTGSDVALAEVLNRIEQTTAYMYKMTVTTTRPSQSSTGKESVGTALISQDHGMKMTIETIDPNSNESTRREMYVLPRQGIMLTIRPQKKSYERFKLNDTLIETFQKQCNDPRSMIKKMLSCEYSGLGQSVIDGIKVEGFHTTDPAYGGSAFGKVDVKVWVDVKTGLPVRSEMFITEEIEDAVLIHRVLDDFQWNVSVDAAEFEPDIPDDYTTRMGDLTVPAFTEESAVKGLRVFADLAGDYPDNLGGRNFFKELAELLGPTEDLPPNEKYKKVSDVGMPIAALVSFYQKLVQDKKDPAYFGRFVTPKDADLLLLRWKLSDNEYRVIFGDLHAETVTAERLAELEKALPE